MASPAAVLSVLVDANTSGATAQLSRFDRQLAATNDMARRGIKAELGANFNRTAFGEYEAKLSQAAARARDRNAFKAQLGANFNPTAFNAYERAATRANVATDSTRASSDRLTTTARGLGSRLMGVASVASGASLGIAALGVTSLKSAASFEASMTRIQTQAGASARQVKALSVGVLAMASQVGTSPNVLAEGMYHVASSLNATLPPARRVREELKVLRIAAEGAKVGNANLVDVTNALDSAIVANIKGVKNESQAMGALNAIVGAGDMTMQDLADALGTGILGPMATFGVSLKSVGGALAVFGDMNIRGQDAATKLISAVRIMAAPSKAAAKELAGVGISTLELANDLRTGGIVKALEDLKKHMTDAGLSASQQGLLIARAFGGRQSTGMQVLLAQLDRLKSKTDEVGKGANTFGNSWAATQQTTAFKLDQLRTAFQSAGIQIGQALEPAIPSLIKVAQHFGTFIQQMRDGKGAGGEFASAVKTAFDVIKGVVSTVTGLFGGLKNTLLILGGLWAVGKVISFASALAGVANSLRAIAVAGGASAAAGAAGAAGAGGAAAAGGGAAGLLARVSPVAALATGAGLLFLSAAALRGLSNLVGGPTGQPTLPQVNRALIGAPAAVPFPGASTPGRTQAGAPGGPPLDFASQESVNRMRQFTDDVQRAQLALTNLKAGNVSVEQTIAVLQRLSAQAAKLGDIPYHFADKLGAELLRGRTVSSAQIQSLLAQFDRLAPGVQVRTAAAMIQMARTLHDQGRLSNAQYDAILSRLHGDTKRTFDAMEHNVATKAGSMRNAIVHGSSAAASQATANLYGFAKNVDVAMTSGVLSTQSGGALIAKAEADTIKAFGGNVPRAVVAVQKATIGASLSNLLGNITHFAGGGLVQLGQPGQGGRDSIALNAGGVPIVAAPGEQVAVFTRHQQQVANAALAPMGGLPGLFRNVSRPNYMAGGGIVTASTFGGPGDPGTGSVGYRGDDLYAHPDSFAELNMGTALGNLPYLSPITVTLAGKTIKVFKRDIGAGGAGIGGAVRAVDLWFQAANAIGLGGLANVLVNGGAGVNVNIAGGGAFGNIQRITAPAVGGKGTVPDIVRAALGKIADAANAQVAKLIPIANVGPTAFGGPPVGHGAYAALSLGRTDQGVDFGGAGPVGAVLDGVVRRTSIWPGWPGTGGIVYGTSRGNVYVMEDFQPSVSIGQAVKALQIIGRATGGGSGIETGWANAAGTGPLTPYNGRPDGTPMPGGIDFRRFLGFARGGFVPFAGSFADGGTVPGPVGQPSMALVHGGERVLRAASGLSPEFLTSARQALVRRAPTPSTFDQTEAAFARMTGMPSVPSIPGSTPSRVAGAAAIAGLIGSLKTDAERLEHEYGSLDSFYSITPETLVNPDTGEVDKGAVARRVAQLDQLIALRVRIFNLWQRIIAYSQRLVAANKLIVARFRKTLAAIKTKGLTGNALRIAQQHQTDARSAISTYSGNLTTAQADLMSSADSRDQAWIDLLTRRTELATTIATKATPTTAAATTAAPADTSALLQTLLTQAQQRTAVSEAALRVFSQSAGLMLPFAGAFQHGGTIGPWALVGENGPELARLPTGTRINPSPTAGVAPAPIQVLILDGAVDPDKIRVIASDEAEVVVRREVRLGGRVLPGLGGGR